MKTLSYTTFLFIMTLFIGCAAMESMTIQEKAQTTGYEMAVTYQNLYATYKDLKAIDAVVIPESVTNSMNTVKKLIVNYNDAVILLAETNSTAGISLDILENNIKMLLTDLALTLTSLEAL